MVAPRPDFRRHLAKAVLLAAAAATAWKALVLGLGALYQADPGHATTLDQGNASAALALAKQAAARPDLRQRAGDAVRRALTQRPVDGRLFRALAQLDQGDATAARRRWQAAALLRPADVQARAWLADEAVAQGDFIAALEHTDALLRVAPAQTKNLFPILAQWLSSGEHTAAFAQTLEQRPPWRRSFADYLAREGTAASLYSFAQVAQRLRRGPAPLDPQEARGLVNRLVQEQDFERAYLLWRSVLPPLQESAGMLYNGGFEMPASAAAFDWTLRSTPGAGVSVEDGGTSRGKVLRLRFSGVPVTGIGVEQTLLLPRGVYRFLGQARQQDRHGTPLEWRIYCLAGSSRLVATGPLAQDDHDWSSFDFRLAVPAEDCSAQRLQLAAKRDAAGRPLAGTVWFDDLAVQAQASPGGPPPAHR
ncbi:hypothetical protein [Tahibacter harae]|uniref:Tetratricopeptide repeat protein n=1 Tax=Tahibacter harae TaxID=2963937 RepID=A0ABT1QT46_9GAMM|nr:hypothetical protein [Tahibacter harae]MCQ4165470.1 hypothetical protein [Tahibacter harae]